MTMPTINLDHILTSEIQRPARYLGKEVGSVHRVWNSAKVRWVLSYPELYEVGASNLGHLILYNVLNSQLDQLCDRVYLPGPDLAQRLRQLQIPLFAVESRRPLQEFDLIGFSLAYELGGTNILEMLQLAGIPLTWSDRNHRLVSDCPLIFAGGPTATSNPEPFADFFDFFVLGDGEEVLPEIGQVMIETLDQPRQVVLKALAQVPGVYVPQFYRGLPVEPVVEGVPERIQRRVAAPMPEYSVGLVPYVETVHDRLVMEVRRGCTRGCRFCQPGMLTRPARDVEPDRLVEAISLGLRETGHNEFSLSSLSCSDYLSLPAVGAELQNRFNQEAIGLSLPSQRVDRFDETIAQIIGGKRRTGVTFAPEAGTQRLRDIINKGLTDADLIRGITTAAREGWSKIKLYFMIGLPGETDADVIGIAETLTMLKRECAAIGKHRVTFTLTISNFTPKPHTPFQWFRVDYEDIVRKQQLLRDQIKPIKGVKAHFTDVRFSILEDLIGKGDRRLGRMIEAAWRGGAGMDAWFEGIDQAFAAWTQAYQAVDATFSTTHPLPVMEFDLEDPLPWDHVDTGIDKRWLQRDYQRALEAITVADCSFDQCSACGICGTDFGHNVVLPPPPIPKLDVKSHPRATPPEPIPPSQRFRIVYAKQGDMRWLSHLDLMRLWERVCRRAGLPLAFSGGYHPTPRLSSANALPLGYTSQGEVLDIELVPLQLFGSSLNAKAQEIHQTLQKQLPAEIKIYSVQEVPVKAASATSSLQAADYVLTISITGDDVTGSDIEHWEALWATWIQAVLDQGQCWLEKTSKSGKPYQVDGRSLLYHLACQTVEANGQATVIYRGCCRNDGTFLNPRQVITMLQQQISSGIQLQLQHVERQGLVFDGNTSSELHRC